MNKFIVSAFFCVAAICLNACKQSPAQTEIQWVDVPEIAPELSAYIDSLNLHLDRAEKMVRQCDWVTNSYLHERAIYDVKLRGLNKLMPEYIALENETFSQGVPNELDNAYGCLMLLDDVIKKYCYLALNLSEMESDEIEQLHNLWNKSARANIENYKKFINEYSPTTNH